MTESLRRPRSARRLRCPATCLPAVPGPVFLGRDTAPSLLSMVSPAHLAFSSSHVPGVGVGKLHPLARETSAVLSSRPGSCSRTGLPGGTRRSLPLCFSGRCVSASPAPCADSLALETTAHDLDPFEVTDVTGSVPAPESAHDTCVWEPGLWLSCWELRGGTRRDRSCSGLDRSGG